MAKSNFANIQKLRLWDVCPAFAQLLQQSSLFSEWVHLYQNERNLVEYWDVFWPLLTLDFMVFFWCIITTELHNIEMAFALWIYGYTQALKQLHARIPSMNCICACGFPTLHNAWRGSRINTLPKTIYWSKLMNSSCYHSLWLLLFLHLGCFLFPQRSLFFFCNPPRPLMFQPAEFIISK